MNEQAKPFIKDYIIDGYDLNRPWGGFYYINKNDLERFIKDHFPNTDVDTNLPLSPKILIVNPEKKLSWQYHSRRKEIWSILKGPVKIARSFDDIESNISIANTGDIITLDKEERHRLIGLDDFAVIAELWCHTDLNHLSDENDIVRIQDDYNR